MLFLSLLKNSSIHLLLFVTGDYCRRRGRDLYIAEKALRGFDTAFAPTTSPRARSAQHRVEVITASFTRFNFAGQNPRRVEAPRYLLVLCTMLYKHNSWGMQITQYHHNLLLYYRERICIIIWSIRKRRDWFIVAHALDPEILWDFTFLLPTTG